MSPSISKSFRLEEDLSKRIPSESNLSSLVNVALRDYLNKDVWIPNFKIHEHAEISAAVLFERIKDVQYLRYSADGLEFTFYPTSEDEIKRNKQIFDYANGNFNEVHDGSVYFNIKFPVNFLMFLKSKTWAQVQSFIKGFLACLYWIDKDKRSIMEKQLDKKVLQAVVKIFESERFEEFKKTYKEYSSIRGAKMRGEYNDAYFKLLIDLDIDPIMLPYLNAIVYSIHFPFHFKQVIPQHNPSLGIKLETAYMRDVYEEKDDWTSIVVKGTRKNESLHRAESKKEPWEIWHNEYEFYHWDEIYKNKRKTKI